MATVNCKYVLLLAFVWFIAGQGIAVAIEQDTVVQNVNREIELKFAFNEQERLKLVSWLDQHAEYQGVMQQEDRYFDRPSNSYFTRNEQGIILADSFLRVRITTQGSFLCLKKWHRHPETGEKIYCDEYETKIENGETASLLLLAENYQLDTIIRKQRKTYRSGWFEVAIDTVEELGAFVEVELKDFPGSVDEGIVAIKNFVKQCGFLDCIQVKNGYILMKKNLQHDFGVKIIL